MAGSLDEGGKDGIAIIGAPAEGNGGRGKIADGARDEMGRGESLRQGSRAGGDGATGANGGEQLFETGDVGADGGRGTIALGGESPVIARDGIEVFDPDKGLAGEGGGRERATAGERMVGGKEGDARLAE